MTDTFGLTKNGLILRRRVSKARDGAERSILIEKPEPGAQVAAGPVEVRGRISVAPFENTLSYRVYDVLRRELSSGMISVNNGTFAASVDLSTVAAGTQVSIEIADLSAADGAIVEMDSVVFTIK